jgi:hypothetical protein
MSDIIDRLEFGCPLKPYMRGVTEIGEKDAEAAERIMQEAADIIRGLRLRAETAERERDEAYAVLERLNKAALDSIKERP